MSLGYGWCANLIMSDESTAAYTYHTYDFSLPPGEDGWGITEDDGLMWAYVTDDEGLKVELEKASRYCNVDGLYSAQALFFMCANKMKSQYQDEGTFPLKVFGSI